MTNSTPDAVTVINVDEASTPRKYEKIGLAIFSASTLFMFVALILLALQLQSDAVENIVFFGLFIPIFSMPALLVAAVINCIVMLYQHARFLSKRGAITLGILFGSIPTWLIATFTMVCLIVAAIDSLGH